MKKPPKEELLLYKNKLRGAAKRYGVSVRTIRRWLDFYNLYQPLRGYGPGKLNKVKATEIRRLYHTEKYTQVQLARIFRVSQGMICRVINNKAHMIDIRLTGAAHCRIPTKNLAGLSRRGF